MSNTFTIHYEGTALFVTQVQADLWARTTDAGRQQLWEKWTKPIMGANSAAKPAKELEPTTLSVEQTLAQRGKRYGDFTDHARICQELKCVMVDAMPDTKRHGWEALSDVQKQALEVIADKIARILSGDPNYDDNWIDIQGYAKLVQDRLPKESK